MNINLHIERLILDGLPVEARNNALLQAAVEAELSRLFTEKGIPYDLRGGGNQDRLLAPTLQLNATLDAKTLGTQVGAGIYSAFAEMNQKGQYHG